MLTPCMVVQGWKKGSGSFKGSRKSIQVQVPAVVLSHCTAIPCNDNVSEINPHTSSQFLIARTWSRKRCNFNARQWTFSHECVNCPQSLRVYTASYVPHPKLIALLPGCLRLNPICPQVSLFISPHQKTKERNNFRETSDSQTPAA